MSHQTTKSTKATRIATAASRTMKVTTSEVCLGGLVAVKCGQVSCHLREQRPYSNVRCLCTTDALLLMTDPDKSNKRLVVVGDRVLITPEEGEERTSVGLYLPPTAVDHQAVQSGRIVATGPGMPLPEPTKLDDEPWRITGNAPQFFPMQAQVGDFALFFRKAAVEIKFEDKQYLVVPQAAILVLSRSNDSLDSA